MAEGQGSGAVPVGTNAGRRAGPPAAGAAGGRGGRARPQAYAALDLGTNNCRLLIATPAGQGFRVIDAFSRVVRLGEGMGTTGRLSDAAMDRAVAALGACAEKVRRRQVAGLKAVATQACRAAGNGAEFVARVAKETGIRLEVISPREEARLSVAGCRNLLDQRAEAALVLDVGGGSTELSWLDLRRGTGPGAMRAWLSIPVGVVSLAERFPEEADRDAWFETMVAAVRAELKAFPHAEGMRPAFADGRAQLVGTSGAITSLAGMHLGLARYDRARVDGLWLTDTDCRTAAARLLSLDTAGRAEEPCIGADRADLVLAGAAILEAVQREWPCRRVRVADRGLREGLLLAMMSEGGGAGRRRRRSRS
ncbi:MAG: Ppx/GppA family phosphatase [Proteobacteria bacterium]|nr:Ppx/GppA family phosphatase [Pseudomonadota bacterium]